MIISELEGQYHKYKFGRMGYSNIFRRALSKSPAQTIPASPPPYSNGAPAAPGKATAKSTPARIVPIEATDTPQWKWTELQCQEWYAAVFVESLEYSPQKAMELARTIEGWGPSIFMRTKEDWIKLLANGKGIAIYALIVSKSHKRGAVPFNFWTFV